MLAVLMQFLAGCAIVSEAGVCRPPSVARWIQRLPSLVNLLGIFFYSRSALFTKKEGMVRLLRQNKRNRKRTKKARLELETIRQESYMQLLSHRDYTK